LYLKKLYDPEREQSFIPTLLHRIDKNTVGLVMCAKNATTARILMEKIKHHEVDKYYLCKVYGKVQPPHRILKDY
jgi:23S rRNA pseudouridine955/2504/2580 synthase